jgi:hypothetical protein
MNVAHSRSVIGVLDPRSGGRQVRYPLLDLPPDERGDMHLLRRLISRLRCTPGASEPLSGRPDSGISQGKRNWMYSSWSRWQPMRKAQVTAFQP